jgi:hypothetical protein
VIVSHIRSGERSFYIQKAPAGMHADKKGGMSIAWDAQGGPDRAWGRVKEILS